MEDKGGFKLADLKAKEEMLRQISQYENDLKEKLGVDQVALVAYVKEE